MARIRYFDGTKYVEIEVTEEFAAEYAAMEHRDKLVERKETRRHQSLDKSMEHGWDIADPSADVDAQAERNADKIMLKTALSKLTDKQRAILFLHIENGQSFRAIAAELGLNKDTVREHYLAAIKNLKKFLKNTPSKFNSRGY
ncbi:MAG TPA: sigma-70 family RNA polymerase sigma factor [Candidatus Borkfalkia avicola]|uniref:Sigma-70 family RNA polymerase sigma factor n=1 Tax=Candidatus Borkfalkia avicola TaxID=2838503 RepID=A0A9D2D5V8_9FIRM|nr:sigma-70 family RNA polymerase sigma factor [Candidatus Borkfalkia avicola]